MPSDIQTFPNVSFFVTSLARKFAPLTEFRHNPLKKLDSEKTMKGNERSFTASRGV